MRRTSPWPRGEREATGAEAGPRRPTVLVVDGDPQIHRLLTRALDAAGYAVLHADDAAEGLRLVVSRAPVCLLLDLDLPDMDGKDMLRRLRAFSDVAALVVSTRGEEAEKVAAFDAGADDYVMKPFGVAELLARLRAATRRERLTRQASPLVRSGPLEVDLEYQMVRVSGVEATVTPREWAVLVALAAEIGKVVTQRQLLTRIWGPAHAESAQYLRVYVSQLRRKLGAAGALLRTENGVGYRLLKRVI